MGHTRVTETGAWGDTEIGACVQGGKEKFLLHFCLVHGGRLSAASCRAKLLLTKLFCRHNAFNRDSYQKSGGKQASRLMQHIAIYPGGRGRGDWAHVFSERGSPQWQADGGLAGGGHACRERGSILQVGHRKKTWLLGVLLEGGACAGVGWGEGWHSAGGPQGKHGCWAATGCHAVHISIPQGASERCGKDREQAHFPHCCCAVSSQAVHLSDLSPFTYSAFNSLPSLPQMASLHASSKLQGFLGYGIVFCRVYKKNLKTQKIP